MENDNYWDIRISLTIPVSGYLGRPFATAILVIAVKSLGLNWLRDARAVQERDLPDRPVFFQER